MLCWMLNDTVGLLNNDLQENKFTSISRNFGVLLYFVFCKIEKEISINVSKETKVYPSMPSLPLSLSYNCMQRRVARSGC